MKDLQYVPDDELQALTYEDYGQTMYLESAVAAQLLELKKLLGSPTLEGAARLAIERQLAALKGTLPTREERPLVSSGQIEVRRRDESGDRLALSNAIVDRLGWIPDSEHRVLTVMARLADATGKVSRGQTEIGRHSGLNRSQVCRLIQRLVLRGYLELLRRHHTGSKNPNVYRIRPIDLWPIERPDSTLPTWEEPPLVSLGQGEYRRDIHEVDC